MGKEKIIQLNDINEIIWKHPAELVDCNTRIYVPTTHVCLYMKEGLMLDTLEPGKHQVVAKKGLFSKKETFMSSFVYVNVQQVLNLNWGTKRPIEVFDPLLSIPCEIRANGRYQISISNPREFILKVGGLESKFSTSDLEEYMSVIVISNIKEAISKAMVSERISFYDIWANMSKLSDGIKNFLINKFNDYGVSLKDFSVADIIMPEDVRQLVKHVHMEKYDLSQKGLSHRELYENQRSDEHEAREMTKDIVKSSVKEKKDENNEDKIIICSACGTTNDAGARYCKSCGNRLN